MSLRRYGTFTGGIDLPDQKSSTLNRRIKPALRPSRLLVPLNPCGGQSATPLVAPGERVQADQRLAAADSPDAVDVFAPLDGTVASVSAQALVAGASAFAPGPAIELTDLGDCPPLTAPRARGTWLDRPTEALTHDLHAGQLTTHRRPIEPLNAWLDRAAAARCDVLVANAVEGQPYVTADHRLLYEHGADVVAGLAVLARVLRPARVMLAVDHRHTSAYHGLAQAATSQGMATIALPHKYPAGADTLLTKVLTRRTVRPGRPTTDAGVAVIDPATCFAVFRWIVCGQRAAARVVTVSGERAGRRENFWTPLGYPCDELIGGSGPGAPSAADPVIHGGPMSGLRCPAGAVVTPATDALLAIDEAPPAVPTPCIRCGWCTDNCPVRLNVAILNDDFELAQVDHARRLNVAACLACGVCSYVCPARLPLAARVGRLKQAAAPAPEAAR